MSVGERIRHLREEKKLLQMDVAEQAGISQAMLSQIERGTKNPSLQVAKEISKIIGCSLDDLIAENNPNHKAE